MTTFAIVCSVVLASLFLICIFGIFWFFVRGKKRASLETKGKEPAEVAYEADVEADASEFLVNLDLNGIKRATQNFSHRIGDGRHGPVYRGKLPNGREIAVKRLRRDLRQSAEEFDDDVRLLRKLHHGNVVRLLGGCSQNEERILIYDYIPSESLDKFLSGDLNKRRKLDWTKRYSIIKGIAQGLCYLHQYPSMKIFHRDLKPSNILLDADMNPFISDFATAKLCKKHETSALSSNFYGTFGRLPPEYVIKGAVSAKVNVFSFGILVLELISGQKIKSSILSPKDEGLLNDTWRLWEESRAIELLDEVLVVKETEAEEVLRCIHLGLLCVQEDARDRPQISEVVPLLDGTPPLPSPSAPAYLPKKGRRRRHEKQKDVPEDT